MRIDPGWSALLSRKWLNDCTPPSDLLERAEKQERGVSHRDLFHGAGGVAKPQKPLQTQQAEREAETIKWLLNSQTHEKCRKAPNSRPAALARSPRRGVLLGQLRTGFRPLPPFCWSMNIKKTRFGVQTCARCFPCSFHELTLILSACSYDWLELQKCFAWRLGWRLKSHNFSWLTDEQKSTQVLCKQKREDRLQRLILNHLN